MSRKSNYDRKLQVKLQRHLTNLIWLRCKSLTCHWCGYALAVKMADVGGDVRKLTLDHVIPRGEGGSHTLDNVVLACFECNAARNNEKQSIKRGENRAFGLMVKHLRRCRKLNMYCLWRWHDAEPGSEAAAFWSDAVSVSGIEWHNAARGLTQHDAQVRRKENERDRSVEGVEG